DRRVRQPPLHANEVDAVPLEIVRGRSAVAERLALQNEPAKPLVQLCDGHANSLAPAGTLDQRAGWCLEVRLALVLQVRQDSQDAPVVRGAGGQAELRED